MILLCSLIKGQSIEGRIIKIDGDKVYISLHHPSINVSDVLSVISNGSSVALIEITAIPGAYSVGRVLGDASMPLVEKMIVWKDDNLPPVNQSVPAQVNPVETPVQQNNYSPPMDNNTPIQPETRTNIQPDNQSPVNNNGKVTVMIAPADVNFPQGVNNMVVGANGDTGYIGDYVIAALSEQLLKCDKVQLLDQSTAQEMGLRARYKIKVTMLKPDVASVSNDIPAGGILRVVQSLSNNNVSMPSPLQQAVPEDVNTKKVKVMVNIIVNIVDLQTGAILPSTFSAAGKGSGSLQLSLANSTTGNLNINQGADFSQTAIGQAIEDAFKKIGKELNNYFNNQINN